MPFSRNRDPRTKEELLDRMLSFDFDGDIRNLGVEPAMLVRTKANALNLVFPSTGTIFELVIRRPRKLEKEVASAVSVAAREYRSFQARTEGPPAPPAEPEEWERERPRSPQQRGRGGGQRQARS